MVREGGCEGLSARLGLQDKAQANLAANHVFAFALRWRSGA
jgi:hypothetical protein